MALWASFTIDLLAAVTQGIESTREFIPMTGPGASGWSSLAFWLLFLSSFWLIALEPPWPCSFCSRACLEGALCASLPSRCNTWSSPGLPCHPGVEFSEPLPADELSAKFLFATVKGRTVTCWAIRGTTDAVLRYMAMVDIGWLALIETELTGNFILNRDRIYFRGCAQTTRSFALSSEASSHLRLVCACHCLMTTLCSMSYYNTEREDNSFKTRHEIESAGQWLVVNIFCSSANVVQYIELA